MKSIDMSNFIEEKVKENQRYLEIEKRLDETSRLHKIYMTSDKDNEYDKSVELMKELLSLEKERAMIYNKYVEIYEKGIFYTLMDEKYDINIFRIGYCDSQYYIIYYGEINSGDLIIFFDTKEEILKYLNLDILNNLLK
jgi:hypothetical protein